MNAIINRTIYSKEFYKTIANYRLFKDSTSLIGIIAALLSSLIAIATIIANPSNTNGYIYLAIGLLFVPICFFYLPYKTNCDAYKQTMKKTGNKDFIVEVKFGPQSLNMSNNIKQSGLHYNTDIKSIKVKNNLIVVNFRSDFPLYIDKNSFVDCTYDDFKKYIQRNTKIIVKD